MKIDMKIEVAMCVFDASSYDEEGISALSIEQIDENGDRNYVEMTLSPLDCKKLLKFFTSLHSLIKREEPI